MNRILVLNLGSTSFKYQVFNVDNLESVLNGNFEIKTDKLHGIQAEIDKIFRKVLREIGNIESIKYVAHRYVHGGDIYQEIQEVNQDKIDNLEKLNDLAPLHNPFNLAGVKASLKYLPQVKNYIVFDTAFFKDLPDVAKIYPIPYKYFQQGIKKYGFHGISHKFVTGEACHKLKLNIKKSKLITIHLGGGCSITATENGKPIETSMGYTPLSGLVMQTRSGDIDPGIIFELLKENGGDFEKVKNILNKKSGIKGLFGNTNFLDLLTKVKAGELKANLTFDIYIRSIRKMLGAYLVLLNGADAIVFTGGIGAGASYTRNKIIKNNKIFKNIKVIAIKTNEELAIAKEVLKK